MDRFAANSIDSRDSNPVTGDGTSANQDQVTDRNVVEDLVDRVALGVTNRLQDGCVVETDTIEGNVEEEPGTSSTKQDLAVLPLAVVVDEVAPRSLGDFHARGGIAHLVDAGDLIGDALGRRRKVGLDVGAGLDNVAGDVKGVTRGLGNGQAVVESNAAWNSTEADDHTPHLVDSDATDATALVDTRCGKKRLLEADSDDERHDAGGELANTLHGENGAHHGTTPLGSSEFRCNDGAERVVTSDTDWGNVSLTVIIMLSGLYLLPMRTRQKITVPTIDIAGESEERA